MKYLPEIVLPAVGLGVIPLLLYLTALSSGWVRLLCILATAVVFTGWHKVWLDLAWRLAGKNPDDFDCHFPG